MKAITDCHIILKIEINNEDIDNILEKTLNEDSIHWRYDVRPKNNQNATVKGAISSGGILFIYGMDDRVYQLTIKKLMRGLRLALPYLSQVFNGINLNIRSIDSDGADLILQLALFNKLLYE